MEVVNPYQQIADVVLDRWHGEVLVAGIAGPVGVGKSTTAERLAGLLRDSGRSALVVSTDGFLFSNAELDRRGLTLRKGFRTRTTSTGWARSCGRPGRGRRPGRPRAPATYDVEPRPRAVDGGDVVLLEGVNALQDRASPATSSISGSTCTPTPTWSAPGSSTDSWR